MRPRRQFDTGVDAGSNDAALKSAEPGRLGRVRVRSLAARAAAGFLVALAALLALPMQAQAQTTVTISADKTSAVFRVDPITYTLTRTGSMTDALPVTVLLTQSEDFLKASELTKTVTIGAGKSTETFTVAASSFQHFEVGTKVEGGTLTAAVQNGAAYDLGMMASVEVNFFIGVMIQFEMASYSVGEATGPLAVKVIARTGPHAGQPPAAATYVYELVTAEGNANNSDFFSLVVSTEFLPGNFYSSESSEVWQAAHSYDVKIKNDAVDEVDETFDIQIVRPHSSLTTYSLVDASGNSCGIVCTATVTIVDDDTATVDPTPVDTTAPTVTITSAASEPVSGPFSITVTFSEPVTGFELQDLVVGNGSASELQGNEASYTATVTPTASGAVTVDIAAGAAEDSAGNPSVAADQFSITADPTPVDTTAPTVTITSAASEPVSGPFSITVTFSEPVTGFDLPDLVVGNGSASELQGNEASYTATVTPTASGAVTVDIAAGAAEDSAGNPSVAADQFSITADPTPVDTTAPTVTITSAASEPVSGPFSITVTFSEPVTGFDLPDLVVGNGSASELQGNEASYTATVTPTASGAVTVDIAAGAAEDSAGNPSVAADQFSITADPTPVDTTAPTVTITSAASEPVSGPFSITVTFSEPVTGFDLPDLVVGNGSASELQGNEASYTATVTPTASGAVTVDIAAGAAEDSAGNPSAAADQFSITADPTPVDTTAPTVTITSAASEPVSGPFSITVTFSEPVTGFELQDLVVGNGSASELQGNETSYTATVTPTASGAVTVDIAAEAAEDSAGNPSAAADQFSITADLTPVPALPLAGAVALAALLLIGGIRRRPGVLTT